MTTGANDVTADGGVSPQLFAAAATATSSSPVSSLVGLTSDLVNVVLNPLATTSAPGAPVQAPVLWALLAFARREFEPVVSVPSLNGDAVAGPISSEAVTGTPTPVALSIGPVPSADVPAAEGPWTGGHPSIVHQLLVVQSRALNVVAHVGGL